MKIRKPAALWIFLPVWLAVAATETVAQTGQRTAEEVTTRIHRRYSMIDNATAEFTQHVKFSFSRLEQTFAGILTMKKPNKFRIESEHQTLVTDGSTVWAYSPVNNQVVIDRYKENENSISPERFLLNLPASYYVSVLGSEREGGADFLTLKLVPRDDRSFVKSAKLWVDEKEWSV
ncbi:MAG: outer membrane lipoprotein carrier protein LolA, partial [Bacteroidota bacterium]